MTHAPIPLRSFLDAANKLRFVSREDFNNVLPSLAPHDARDRWCEWERDPILWLCRAEDHLAEAVWRIAQKEQGT